MKYIKTFNEHKEMKIGSELKTIQSYDAPPSLPGFTQVQPYKKFKIEDVIDDVDLEDNENEDDEKLLDISTD